MNEVREKIIHEAIKLFSTQGYHKTSMRDIMNAAGCAQPTLYYYFENKQALFQEAVLGEFQKMVHQFVGDADPLQPVKDLYVQAVIRRKHFTEYQKQVYRLAIQGWYHLLGDEEVESRFCVWVDDMICQRKAFLRKLVADPERAELFANLVMHVFLNMTEQIVLKNADLPDEEINRRFTVLFELI